MTKHVNPLMRDWAPGYAVLQDATYGKFNAESWGDAALTLGTAGSAALAKQMAKITIAQTQKSITSYTTKQIAKRTANAGAKNAGVAGPAKALALDRPWGSVSYDGFLANWR